MSRRFSTMLSFLCCIVMMTSLMPVSIAADTDNIDNTEVNEKPTAMFGTPELGSDDPLWSKTMEYPIDKSTVPDDSRPHATGTVKILWDNDHLYARVIVEDSNLYQGSGGDHTYDSLEFYVGPGSNGSNQWRVSATGIFSGQSHTDRAAWTQITDSGYIVEMRIPRRSLTLEPGNFTFEVYINNSTENGADRYEVVSAFGNPDTGYGGHGAFADSLELIEADELDNRFSINTSTGTGGRLTPNAPGHILRVASGENTTFTITPDHGKIVDTVTVDDEAIAINDNTFSLPNISADHQIHVTFKDDPAADKLPFIVWNDNFASGEYTTAAIIDLGEGKEASGSELHPGLFAVSARNTTLVGDSLVFEGTRTISRVYANDEPNVRGYVGKANPSPDYQVGLASGRYIVVELEFYTEVGGNTTLYSSNSTNQNYSIVQNGEIVLTEGNPLSYVVFEQEKVVNPILDKFTTHTSDSVNRALYLHTDENDEVLQGLPLYVYTHGMSRGGTNAGIDQKASMKSANGSVALMKKIEENPGKYASHILNISYNGLSTPSTANVKKVIDDLVASGAVDPNRIYVAGFSWGGQYTNSLINAYPGFFAAAAPMAPVSGSPNANDNDAHSNLAYWMFINVHNTGTYQTNLNTFINTNMPKMINARASNFESNEALTWPYNQFDQPNQRPNPDNTPPLLDYIAHEVEAAVLYNEISMDNPFTEGTWSIAPIAQSPDLPAWGNDYTNVFDWMFVQSRLGVLPGAPGGLKATAGDGQVTLSWAAPAAVGSSPILGYKVWQGNETPVDLAAEVTGYTFTGLTNGQNYTFKIVAVSAVGDSAEATATTTPRRTPVVTDPPPGGNTNNPDAGNTDDETDTGSSEPTYTVNTPQDKPAVTDTNGTTTLPGGGLITTKGGTKLELPEGTTIDSNGKVTIPANKSAEFTLPGDNDISLNIHEGSELLFDDDSPLGFIVISGNSFNDVIMDDWFYSYVNSVYTFGLFNGMTPATFSPGNSMTRSMYVHVLANLENVNRSDYTSSRFNDVTDGQWYTAAVEWAAENGIVNGVNAELFDPNTSVSREQMLVILYNYMDYKGYEIPQSQAQSFADESEISSWALEAVKALQGIGIVTGKGNNIFDPKGTATRAEVAAIFVRFVEYLAK